MRRKVMKRCLVLLAAVSCQMLGYPEDSTHEKGELRISFTDELPTKAVEEIPDTSDFLLTVSGPDCKVIYDGVYGDSPESIMVDAGSYTVFVRSCDFTKPAFAVPQYGDEQCVVVPSGGVADVKLTCVQMNAGVLLRVDKSFLTNCPDAVLFLKSSAGKLMYSYSEKRIAYFPPGSVSLMMSANGSDKVLLTRTLQPRTVLEIGVSAAGSSSSGQQEKISVAVDTSRTWNTESYVIGGGGSSGKGNSVSDALTVSQAAASAGEEDVWVSGYIVGGDLTSSSASFKVPFKSMTNILLGPRASVADKSACISVQLPDNEVREALNLVEYPGNLGRRVCVKGDIVASYYGICGMKNTVEYVLY
jgi:hypothetical protein